MRTSHLLSLVAILSICNCSHPGSVSQTGNSQRHLEFSQIERLGYGHINKDEISRVIGESDQVINLKDGTDVWVYFENIENQSYPRVNLSIERATGILLSATWILREGEDLQKMRSALSYFQKAKFKVSDIGWESKHSYSSDAQYIDKDHGISMYVNKIPQTVQYISYFAPESIASDESKKIGLGSER